MDTVDGFSDPVSVLVGREELCAEVLGALPKRFGRPSAVDTYVAASRDQPMLACFGSDGVVGMLSLKLHGTATAEIHVLGVKPDWHRHGVGRALIRAAIAEGVTRGLKFLTVKTLASSHPDVNYAGTRRFYEAMGFWMSKSSPRCGDQAYPALSWPCLSTISAGRSGTSMTWPLGRTKCGSWRPLHVRIPPR